MDQKLKDHTSTRHQSSRHTQNIARSSHKTASNRRDANNNYIYSHRPTKDGGPHETVPGSGTHQGRDTTGHKTRDRDRDREHRDRDRDREVKNKDGEHHKKDDKHKKDGDNNKKEDKPGLDIKVNYMVRNRWQCIKKLGSGGFGEVHMAYDKEKDVEVAIKMESLQQNKQVLKMEVAVLKKLQDSSKHVCKLIDCGRNHSFNYMVMTLLGPSLADLRRAQPANCFSLSTSLRISQHMLLAVRDIHNATYLHACRKAAEFVR